MHILQKFDNAVNKAINKEIDIPKELSNLFDKEEKMTILPNSTINVKKLHLRKNKQCIKLQH